MDIRIEKTERAIKQAFMEQRTHKPLEKIKIKDLCALANINKSTFYAHYEDIYALADAMEKEAINNVLSSLPAIEPNDLRDRAEWLTQELFHAFVKEQEAVNILFSGSRQGGFINGLEQEMRRRIAENDPTFTADPARGIMLSFCVQGCYYAFTNHCGQMDEKQLVQMLGSIARAAQRIEV